MNSERAEKSLEFLSEIIGVLKSSHPCERVFHFIVDRLIRIFALKTCAIILIDPATEYLSIENSHGLSWTFCKEFRRRLATGAIGRLIWTGRPILLADAALDPRLAEEIGLENPFGCCGCLQIAVNGRAAGYLYCDAPEPYVLNGDDLPLLQMMADLAGVALNKTRMAEENLRLDRVDHETGLEKYVPFLEKLNVCRERASDENERFGVFLLDVDNFKNILNTYGYETSRVFLRELGAMVKSRLRTVDAAARYGPDEVVLLIDNVSMEEAVRQARDLREAVEKHRFTELGIESTVSIGVAAYPQNGRTNEDLLQTARKAVFEAQRSGRNKVFYYLTEWYAHDAVLHEE